MSTTEPQSDLRPARVTERLGLPVPGDAGPADYVTATGAIADRLDLIAGAVLVTALPSAPADGEEVYFVADAATGVLWHLRHNAGSAGPYRWQFVGGPPLSSRVSTQEQNLAGADAWGDLATVGPQLTVPLAGDYLVELGATTSGVPSAAYTCFTGVSVNGAPPTLFGYIAGPQSGGVRIAGLATTRPQLTLTAGDVLKVQYQTNVTIQWFGRWLDLLPIRVG